VRYRRNDVVERALAVLDEYGLADLSMRRIASELGLQPSALYHHFANKQSLLAAVADEVLARGSRGQHDQLPWDDAVVAISHELRDAMLAYRDGAELVATVHAYGLGTRSPVGALVGALSRGGFAFELAHPAATTIVHFVFGHVSDEQMHLQADSAGALGVHEMRPGSSSFELGLGLILDGVRQRRPVHQPAG
jgi:TetR/AcrR family transcriptional regulator, tetracycline repressor protein